MRNAASSTKSVFFISHIDPIVWPFLALFIRPFFQIACFQSRGVAEKGFHRLKISDLSADEFQNDNVAGVRFAKKHCFNLACIAKISCGARSWDLTNYFAKDALQFTTDLYHAASILAKTRETGIFVLNGWAGDEKTKTALASEFAERGGLRYSPGWDGLIGGLCGGVRFLIRNGVFWGSFFLLLFKRRGGRPRDLNGKVLYISTIPGELEPDFFRNLSAGFFIDDAAIAKKDVIFIGKETPQSQRWRLAGYRFHQMFDLADGTMLVRAVVLLAICCLRSPRTVTRFILRFPPWWFHHLVLTELLCHRWSLKGVMYTNSDVGLEPIQGVPFRSRGLPVVLFFYSASLFNHPMWAYLQANPIFVWNSKMIEFLEEHPQLQKKDFIRTGPLMQVEDCIEKETFSEIGSGFYLNVISSRVFTVGVFDSPAVRSEILEDLRFIQSPSVTPQIHKDFLFDVFSLLEVDKHIRVVMKPKRWTKKHDIDSQVQMGFDQWGDRIILLPPSVNPHIAIQNSDFVICIPYTSIFLSALQKSVPAYFYYPQEDPVFKKFPEFQRFLICGRQALRKKFYSVYRHGQSDLPTSQEYDDLVGIPKEESVRQAFIRELAASLSAAGKAHD